eukprot:scaffold201055_cov29-Tisochrysis_lutea.AAC.18
MLAALLRPRTSPGRRRSHHRHPRAPQEHRVSERGQRLAHRLGEEDLVTAGIASTAPPATSRNMANPPRQRPRLQVGSCSHMSYCVFGQSELVAGDVGAPGAVGTGWGDRWLSPFRCQEVASFHLPHSYTQRCALRSPHVFSRSESP